MSLKEAIDFANSNPACYVGTCEGEQPRVRGFLMWFANETGFYFHTGTMKQVYRQMQSNPNVEICFFAQEPEEPAGKMLRVAGKVEFVDDIKLKEKLLKERPFLQAICADPADPGLVVFRVYTGEAYFWTMGNNTRENEVEHVKF